MSKKNSVHFSQNTKLEQKEFEKSQKSASVPKHSSSSNIPSKEKKSVVKSNTKIQSPEERNSLKGSNRDINIRGHAEPSRKSLHSEPVSQQYEIKKNSIKNPGMEFKTVEFNKNTIEEQREYEQQLKRYTENQAEYTKEKKIDETSTVLFSKHETSDRGRAIPDKDIISENSSVKDVQIEQISGFRPAAPKAEISYDRKSIYAVQTGNMNEKSDIHINKNLLEEQREYEHKIRFHTEEKNNLPQESTTKFDVTKPHSEAKETRQDTQIVSSYRNTDVNRNKHTDKHNLPFVSTESTHDKSLYSSQTSNENSNISGYKRLNFNKNIQAEQNEYENKRRSKTEQQSYRTPLNNKKDERETSREQLENSDISDVRISSSGVDVKTEHTFSKKDNGYSVNSKEKNNIETSFHPKTVEISKNANRTHVEYRYEDEGQTNFFSPSHNRDSQKESDTKDSPTRLSNQSDNKVFQYSQNAQREQKRFEQNRLNFSAKPSDKENKENDFQSIYHMEIENDEQIEEEIENGVRAISDAQPRKGELDLRNIRTPNMLPHRVANIEKKVLSINAKYLIASTYRGTQTQRGIELGKDIYGTSVDFVLDHARLFIAHSMVREMNSVLEQYHSALQEICGEHGISKYGIIGHVSGEKDIKRMQQGINAILQIKYGKSIRGSGKVGYINAMRFLHLNKESLTPEMQELIKKVYKKTLSERIIRDKSSHFRFLKGIGRRKLRRYAQQTEAGYGFYFALDIVSRTNSLIRTSIFAIRHAFRAGERMFLISAKASAWAAAKAIKLIPKPIKDSKAGKKVAGTARRIRGTYQKANHAANAGKLKLRNVNDKIRNFRRNPFGIRTGLERAKQKATHALMKRLNRTIFAKPIRVFGKGFNIANKIVAGIGHLFSAMSSIFTGITNLLVLGIGLLILAGFLLAFISSAIGIIVSAFDFSAHEKDIREACLEQIESCYEEQKDELERLRRNFRNVTIRYQDVKDEAIYEENKVEIAETTNSAELLSMATVYFDFDLEKAGKNKVKKYIKEIYNGSHIMSIIEKPYAYVDTEGNEHTVVDADITLTTYYFNQLFNCKLSNKGPGVIAGSEITEKVWNYLRTAGVPAVQAAGIMGNIYGESGFNPDLVEHGNGIGFGLCQWSFGRRTELENFARSQGKSPGDLEVQLAFLMTELEPGHFNSYYTGENNYKKFMQAQDPETATYYFMWGWERPSKAAGNSSLVKRQTAARTYYDTYVNRELITEEPNE